MPKYIHQQRGWPDFTWNHEAVLPLISIVRHKQGRLRGYLEALGFHLRTETALEMLTLDVIKSTEIEGEFLNPEQVRSSVARHLGMDFAGLVPSDQKVDGVVEMTWDATQSFNQLLEENRLYYWHSLLFPTGHSGGKEITVGNWRDNEKGPMQVVSGAMGKERVHFEAPDADRLVHEMNLFFKWFNDDDATDAVLKSGIAHLWFVTIHPFDDGNGRIARAIADMQLAKADDNHQRFYSMSAQIHLERNVYYQMLEKTQKARPDNDGRGSLDITKWLLWFLNCLDRALNATDEIMKHVLIKTKFWDDLHETPVNERQRVMINKLFDGFNGKLTSSKWAKIAKCSPDTALRDINDLIAKGVLEKEAAGGRSTSYALKEIHN